jgi:hypothetical protein
MNSGLWIVVSKAKKDCSRGMLIPHICQRRADMGHQIVNSG